MTRPTPGVYSLLGGAGLLWLMSWMSLAVEGWRASLPLALASFAMTLIGLCLWELLDALKRLEGWARQQGGQ